MSKICRFYGLVGSVFMSTIAFPAIAQTTQQVSTQEAVINGSDNQVIQIINQVNIEHPSRGRERRNSSTTQDALQGVSVDGSGNVVIQESTQVNQTESGGRDRPDRGHGRGKGPDFDDDDDRRGYRGDDDDNDDDDD